VDVQRRPAAPRPARVAVVTDSTASLPAGAAERWGITVVPLEVALGDARYREGVDLPATDLVAALTAGTPVTTSQPSPVAFAEAYARAAEHGAPEIVSVHLSGELSGTVRGATLAARTAPVPVHVVDCGSVAMGLGFAAIAAARAAQSDGDAAGPVRAPDGAAVAEHVAEVAASTSVLFLVDSLEHLRRGGRVGAAAAAVGTVLGMRPLLTVRGGRIEVAGKVRTHRAARERLVEWAVSEVGRRAAATVAVHHLGRPDLGGDLADALGARLAQAGTAGGAAGVVVSEVSAVVGAHAGPGMLGVVVAGR